MALLLHREQAPVQVMPDDHSKLVPPLPIPNRTVKQLCADDSAATSVKVGYRQACYLVKQPPAVSPREKPVKQLAGFFSSGAFVWRWWWLSAYALRAKPTYELRRRSA